MSNEKVIKIVKPIAIVGNVISIIIGIAILGVGIFIKTTLKEKFDNLVGEAAGGDAGRPGKPAERPEGPLGDTLDTVDSIMDAVSGALIFFGLWMMFANILGCFVTLAQKPKEEFCCC